MRLIGNTNPASSNEHQEINPVVWPLEKYLLKSPSEPHSPLVEALGPLICLTHGHCYRADCKKTMRLSQNTTICWWAMLTCGVCVCVSECLLAEALWDQPDGGADPEGSHPVLRLRDRAAEGPLPQHVVLTGMHESLALYITMSKQELAQVILAFFMSDFNGL